MIHLLMNALAASAGGGITYVRNVIPHLSRRSDVRTTVVLTNSLRRELVSAPDVHMVECNFPNSAAGRFWYEQRLLPELIRKESVDVLLAAGNFALWKSPVPQILLSRNSLYTSPDYVRDLARRHDYKRWLDTKIKARLAAASIGRADVTVAPSEAFADELRHWVGPVFGDKIVCIHHGFDAAAFRDAADLPAELARRLANPQQALRLLFVSHYNYYRNFETLLRAIPLIRDKVQSRQVELVLTCKLDGGHPGSYLAKTAVGLRDQFNLGTALIELGTVPYHLLHHVYRACDFYVTPAYTETFAHPLVEAMSSGLPIIASDLAVHREICAQAAHYFPPFSAEALANEVASLEGNSALRSAMSQAGLVRARDFSWEQHVDDLIKLAGQITRR